jgi:lipopolysaccharide export system permease protein
VSGVPENRMMIGHKSSKRGVRASAATGVVTGVFRIPRSYAIWTITQIAFYLFLITLLFVTIFLTQHFIDVLKDTADEIDSLIDVVWLVVLTAPEVQFSLPVAVLAAVYLVVLQSRERRELIALAATGIGVRKIIELALIVGVSTLMISVLISGIVAPYARFAFRRDVYAFRIQAIRDGGVEGRFYSFPDYTVFKWPGSPRGVPSPLFVYQNLGPGVSRAISALGAEVTQSSQPNAVDIKLGNVIAINFSGGLKAVGKSGQPRENEDSNCPACGTDAEKMMRVDNYARSFDLDALLRLEPRGVVAAEWTSAELLGLSPRPFGAVSGPVDRDEVVARLVRGLLCLIAPFFAVLAVVWTVPASRALALPFGCAVILFLEIVGLTLAQTLAAFGIAPALIGTAMLFGGCIALAMWQIGVWEAAIIKPALSKT